MNYKQRLIELNKSDDHEKAHEKADEILLEILREEGYEEEAELFEQLKKWYE